MEMGAASFTMMLRHGSNGIAPDLCVLDLVILLQSMTGLKKLLSVNYILRSSQLRRYIIDLIKSAIFVCIESFIH